MTDEIEERGVERRNKNRQNLTPVQFKVHREKERAKDIAETTQKVDVFSFISPTSCTILIIYLHILKAIFDVFRYMFSVYRGHNVGRFKTSCQ